MKIAAAADGKTMESLVSETFEERKYLLIIETDDGSWEVLENQSDLEAAKAVAEKDCEALISGNIGTEPFETLVLAQVTRYMGAGLPVGEALKRMDRNELEFIRTANGEEWHPHDHSACEGHGERGEDK